MEELEDLLANITLLKKGLEPVNKDAAVTVLEGSLLCDFIMELINHIGKLENRVQELEDQINKGQSYNI